MEIEEESLPQAWGRLLQLLNALPDHRLNKNEILDIFYNGLTDASRDYLNSCAGSVFGERTPNEAEILLNNMLTNENNWTPPEPIPKPTPRKRGILFLSPEDMQEAKKSMKEKVLKLKMLRIYLLLKKYMVLIYRLLKKHIILIHYLFKKLMVLITRHR